MLKLSQVEGPRGSDRIAQPVGSIRVSSWKVRADQVFEHRKCKIYKGDEGSRGIHETGR